MEKIVEFDGVVRESVDFVQLQYTVLKRSQKTFTAACSEVKSQHPCHFSPCLHRNMNIITQENIQEEE